ncbi:hypothetical protein B0I31_12054 [Saccharothrix carnea]|uniref:Membrane-associated oxidoreductase n=2 Tax=Saccharothrix carnea TaxID=1280637 RepID=A0A2P8HZC5_SACCR|nr:hypothetical protein B0I31_12054 [Saccharothrix carnea]
MQGVELNCPEIEIGALSATGHPDHVIRAEAIHDLLTGKYGAHPHGIRVRYARIIGSTPKGAPDPSFEFNGLKTPVGLKLERCVLNHPILAHDAHFPWLHLDSCRIPYFQADRIRVDGSVYMRGLTTTRSNEQGAVRLLGAYIGRNLELDRANIRNTFGPAFHAEGIQVDRSLRFRAARIYSDHNTGAIQLVNAHVHGDLWLDGTSVRNDLGPALNAEGIRVEGSLLLCAGFVATACSEELATVHLMSAQIGSRLDFGTGREITGDLWDASRGQERRLFPRRTAAISNKLVNESGSRLTIDLSCASMNELRLPTQTVCEPEKRYLRANKCSSKSKIIVTGLAYSMLSQESVHPYWPHWLRRHMNHFDGEPYRHLATIFQNSGRTVEARRLLIRLENDRRKANKAQNLWSWLARWPWHIVKRSLIGHGYRPGRALLGILGIFMFATFMLLKTSAGDTIHKPAMRIEGTIVPATSSLSSAPKTPASFITPSTSPSPSANVVTFTNPASRSDGCSKGEAIRLAADISVPLINTNARLRCDFRPGSPTGFAIVALLLHVLGWLFATLFVVGVTGIARKD